MKKMIVLQITLLILFSGTLGGLITGTDVYTDVQRKIVTELCLSCIKLKPNTIKEYRFETANGKSHPDFIIENLTDGPIVLDYRITFCPGCDHLEEHVLSKVFDYSYPSDDFLTINKEFKDTNVTFIHMTTDVFPKGGEIERSRRVYDVIGDEGNPMLVFITYGYNHGFIEPYYSTLYSLGSGNYEQDSKKIQNELLELIYESVDLYNEHKEAH